MAITPFSQYGRPAPAAPPRPAAEGLPFPLLAPGQWLPDTPEARAPLERVGWTGDAPAIRASREEASAAAREAARRPPVDPATPPAAYEETPIESLPPEDQARARASIAAVAAAHAPRAAAGPVPYRMDPPGPVYPPEPEPEPEPAPAPPVDVGLRPTHCGNCGWELARADAADVSDDDKYAYLAMLLGGPKVRFRRDAALFGGALTVTFRTVTPTESAMALAQVAADVVGGRLSGVADQAMLRLTTLLDYRLALSVESVGRRDLGAAAVPAGDETPRGPGEDTPLPRLRDWLFREVLGSETVQRAVMAEFYRFNRLVERIESNAANRDFWTGIGAPR